MYLKLIIRNVRRSARDYLIYMVTMTVCSMLFYSFLSVTSRYYHPDLGVEYHLADQAVADREVVAAAIAEGKDPEEAAGPYVTEEAFENWYASFCSSLDDAVGQ